MKETTKNKTNEPTGVWRSTRSKPYKTRRSNGGAWVALGLTIATTGLVTAAHTITATFNLIFA